MIVDPTKRAMELRKTLKKENQILVVDYTDTLQKKDTTKVIDTMPNIRTGEEVFRTKYNVKEIDKLAHEIYGKDYLDPKKEKPEKIENLVKRSEFDFPLWYKEMEDFKMKNICDYNSPLMFQVAGCNFHDGRGYGGCLYCFVDDKSNNGIPGKGKTYLSVEDAVESLQSARSEIRNIYKENNVDLDPKVLRASGGEPTIVLDWILDLWEEIERKNLDFVGRLDSNLSTGKVVDRFEREGIYREDILEDLAKYPIKVLAAIKGVSERNIKENVRADFKMEDQEYSIKKFLEAGFDSYFQMYNPNPNDLENYLEKMDEKIENFSLRVHIGPLKVYGPNKKRCKNIEKFEKRWNKNYRESCEVIDKYLRKNYGVGYKETPRPDVELELNY